MTDLVEKVTFAMRDVAVNPIPLTHAQHILPDEMKVLARAAITAVLDDLEEWSGTQRMGSVIKHAIRDRRNELGLASPEKPAHALKRKELGL